VEASYYWRLKLEGDYWRGVCSRDDGAVPIRSRRGPMR